MAVCYKFVCNKLWQRQKKPYILTKAQSRTSFKSLNSATFCIGLYEASKTEREHINQGLQYYSNSNYHVVTKLKNAVNQICATYRGYYSVNHEAIMLRFTRQTALSGHAWILMYVSARTKISPFSSAGLDCSNHRDGLAALPKLPIIRDQKPYMDYRIWEI